MACAAVAAFVAWPALAQQEAATPTPSPSRTPTVITLPGVVPERYSLPGATPVPLPSTAAPVPVPTPSAIAVPPRIAAPRAARQPTGARDRATVAPSGPAPVAAPTPTSAPAPAQAVVTPAPAVVATPPAPIEPRMPGWLWMLIGAAGTAAVAGVVWILLRRRPEVDEEAETIATPTPVAQPVPPPQPLPRPPSPRASPAPPVQRPQSDPFEITVRPVRIALGERKILLDFELLLGNLQPAPSEGIRLSLAMISANPDQDRILAGFHRGISGEAAGEPFDLAPGGGARMPARLSLLRDRVHVVQVGGRPMFVAMVLVDLRWRGGLSIRRFGADFMIGTAGQSDKVGPIWLDRGPPAGPLGATRYLPREAAAA